MIKIYNASIEQILPVSQKNIPEIQAISFSLMKANQMVLQKISQAMIYAGIDNLPENILDVLAAELRSPYYEPDMAIDKKRSVIKNTLYLYEQSGTPEAVEEMIKYIFGSGELVEWFESEGTPGTFEIRTTAQATEEALDKFSEVIKKVKNVRSHLVSVKFGNKLKTEEVIGVGMMAAKITTI